MILEYEIIRDKSDWDLTLCEFKQRDIFFEYNYFDLYTSQGEKPIMIYMNTDRGKIVYAFMLRDISFHSDFNSKVGQNRYFDISTPYGFGGPLIEVENEEDKIEIITVFYKEFYKFCKDNKIVSEFIRFSPLIKNHEYMEHTMEINYIKKVLVMDFKDLEFSEIKMRRTRKTSVNKAKRMGLRVEFERFPKSFDRQLAIYYDTMDRKGASKAFLFSKEYFDKILNALSENVLIANVVLDGKIINFGLYFMSGETIYAHVSGTDRDYIRHSASDLDYTETIKWAYENGYRYFFLGGGLTASKDDSLYHYKRSFTNTTLDFYTGKKIWNNEDYDYLVSISNQGIKKNEDFFPSYREF